MSAHSLHVMSQTSEIGDIHVYFISCIAASPRSEHTELQNLHKNSEAGLSQKNSHRELTDMVWL